LVERGQCSLDDPITQWVDAKHLEGLFRDDPSKVTLKHLLMHRSGVADYFEGKDLKGVPFVKQVITEPDRYWSPEDLLTYTRMNQKAVGSVGERFHYGDTGYLLVTLAIESMTKMPFRVWLKRDLFDPLGLKNTQSMIYDWPEDERMSLDTVMFDGVNLAKARSLSCDRADGGIVSTPSDLINFHQALHQGKLISNEHLTLMKTEQGKFRAGIHYGLGMMTLHFNEFFFLMRNFPNCTGHIGITATHLFYDPNHDLTIVLNFGSNTAMSESFVFLSQLMGLVKKHAG
jgi:D-alanyl-D-alanine carboxypeptidase